jgi:cobalt-zinc-cadmium efflux system outer membrane protein
MAVAGALLRLGIASLGQASEPPATVPAVDVPSPLHLRDAVRIFRERGFDLLIADASTEAARGDLKTAQAFPNPALTAAGGRAFTYDPDRCDRPGCSATSLSAGLSDQGLVADFVIGKRRLKVDVAREALEAAERSREDAARVLLGTVKEQYIQTVLARVLLEFARETAHSLGETSRLVNDRLRAGDVSEADSARAQTAKLEAEQAVDVAGQQLAAAQAQLAFLLAVRGAVPAFEVDERLPDPRTPAALAGTTEDGLIALAQEHRPDLAAATATVRSAEAALALSRRQRVPDVALTGNYEQQGHGQDALQPPTATFGFQLALPILDRNQGNIAKSEAQLRSQRLLRDKAEAQITADVRTAWGELASARARVERSQSALLESARRARDLVGYQYQKGAVSLFERLDAERVYVAAVVESFQALADYWTALYRLDVAVGMDLEP